MYGELAIAFSYLDDNDLIFNFKILVIINIKLFLSVIYKNWHDKGL
jgi:hypothetical protein